MSFIAMSIWRSCIGVVCWTCDQWVVGSISTGTKLRNNLGQVVHTNVPVSPSSITWYWSKDGDVLHLRPLQQIGFVRLGPLRHV